MSFPLFGTRIIAAPMAGGTSTPAFVRAVHEAGGLGFLAAGYKSVSAMQADIRSTRETGARFGMNVFVPDPAQLDPAPELRARLQDYRSRLLADALRYGVQLPALRLDDDDDWHAKLDALLQDPVELVSFAFGLPGSEVVRSLQRSGSAVLATVTTPSEARQAAEQGVDALVVQHASAGGHSAAFEPAPQSGFLPSGTPQPGTTAELLAQVRSAVALPLVAAGGIMDPAGLKAVLAAGAQAAQLGTAFLRAEESGARQLHKDALASPHFTQTRLTRAFTGRPARALVNEFVRDHADAPEAYPAVHHLTAPIRAAAAAAGDAERLNLWAGTGWQQARSGPVAGIVDGLLTGG
jgi:nitronate monooxygenase